MFKITHVRLQGGWLHLPPRLVAETDLAAQTAVATCSNGHMGARAFLLPLVALILFETHYLCSTLWSIGNRLRKKELQLKHLMMLGGFLVSMTVVQTNLRGTTIMSINGVPQAVAFELIWKHPQSASSQTSVLTFVLSCVNLAIHEADDYKAKLIILIGSTV